MYRLTSFVLRHKALVTLFWLAIAAAGVMTISGTTHRMTNSFSMPGQAFRVDSRIAATYGNGGSQTPYLPVLTVPAGQRIADPAVAAATGRAFAAVARALPHVRIADYATTHDPAFITRDGRTTFALVYTASVSGFGGANLGPAIQHAVAAAAPRGWQVGVTGSQLLANGKPASAKGTGLMTEAMIGSVGALVILAFVFASFLALLPLLIGGVSVLGHVPARRRAHRDHRHQPDRGVPHRPHRAGRGDRLLAAGGQPLARGACGRPRQLQCGHRGDEPRRARGGLLRAHRRHRAAVDDRPAGADAAQRRRTAASWSRLSRSPSPSPCCR